MAMIANAAMAPIHHRMPVVLASAYLGQEESAAKALCVPSSGELAIERTIEVGAAAWKPSALSPKNSRQERSYKGAVMGTGAVT